jgi:hypothetical protein
VPDGGSFIASTSVTILPPDLNATLYYTLDGSLPTTNSLRYTGPFNLLTNTTVSVNAYETNFYNSVAATVQFFVQPLYLTTSSFLANGQYQLVFSGVAGSNYVLQATTNLFTWTPISTNTALTTPFNLLDPKATNFPYRYYRVLQQ